MPGSGKIRTNVCLLIFPPTAKHSTHAAQGVRRCFRFLHFSSLHLYLSLFSSLEYSEIRNSSSVATVEMFSTGQVTASAR